MSGCLQLLVPGLRGPLPGQSPVVSGNALLERWLARADQQPFAGNSLEEVLCALFGVVPLPTGELPFAALSRLGDGAAADDSFWLQANPVCLRPDQGRLLLFDSVDFDLTAADAGALADRFREHFSDSGWRLEVATPQRWYLGLAEPVSLSTRPLGEVFGRNMDRFLPSGDDALRWHGLLNEIQMLFHDAPANQAREAQGKMTIGGLWLSGGGRLPQVTAGEMEQVCSDQPLARGLAVAAGIDAIPLATAGRAPWADTIGQLLVYDSLQRPVWRADPFDWQDAAAHFADWLVAGIDALRSGQFDELLIYPCDGSRFRLDRRGLRRFWRRAAASTL